MTDEKPVPVKVTIDEATAEGHYANFANILHNPTEFVLDFGRVVPGRPDVKVVSRILTTPYHARQLLQCAPAEHRALRAQLRADPLRLPGAAARRDGHADELGGQV